MKLWLLQSMVKITWDEFSGFVVAAESEEQARDVVDKVLRGMQYVDRFSCECIAETSSVTEVGVVLSDFNAG